MMMQHPRVVITGMGVLAANGIGLSAYWDSLLAARSGIRPISLFDTSDFFLKIAGEIPDFRFSDYVRNGTKANRTGRHTQLAIVATDMALADAGLTREDLQKEPALPINIGVSTCAMEMIEDGMHRLFDHGPGRFSPFVVSYALPHGVTHTVAQHLAVPVDGRTISSACQSGADAIQLAYEAIRSGRADVAIAGGTDAPLTPFTLAAFCSGGLRPSDYDASHPAGASRPFDAKRTGGILAEGAGIVVLESRTHAQARGAVPYAEISGVCSRYDQPGSRSCSGLRDTMEGALANAGLMPDAIDYICAHGPSEPVMDVVETEAIKAVFGERAYRIPVSSIKGVTGNALAAQGPMQLIAGAMTARHQMVCPTANLEYPDPDCDLDYVPREPRQARIGRLMVNVHGLGGGNTSMVVEAPDA